MSKSIFSKTSAILIGFLIVATTAGVAFAQNRPQVVVPKVNRIENQIATMREKLASKEAALKLKLQAFRDQKKATAAARISTNLNQINQNQTTQMQKHLDTMTSILDKLETRVNQAAPDIKDPAAAKVAIASARAAIASASALVTAQTQTDYTIQVTTESRIKINAQTIRNKLHTDILALRKAVIDAKQAVSNAIRVAKSGLKEGTSSGQQ